jgi:hypothetical protein
MNRELNGRLATPTALGESSMLPAMAVVPGMACPAPRQIALQTACCA